MLIRIIKSLVKLLKHLKGGCAMVSTGVFTVLEPRSPAQSPASAKVPGNTAAAARTLARAGCTRAREN